ncbi:MAG TPA: protein kinase [Thermoanaerobaculia bacterium]|nr:protein kinase [Thermoanaerobaculia bacterium]
MQLDSGTRLGPYEILAPAGAGGMGQVYRARDTRLGRDVAIKVLSSHLSGDPHLRDRFDREARAISKLTHAHICTLYDVGHQDGSDYLVMEFLEGETLADRLTRGPLPLKDVIRYGAEIAEALDKAHKNGIIHRDLKPGNVMITKSGAKVLDFGLAKYATPDAGRGTLDATALPTEHRPITEEGTILGTIQYMAPEQLEGEEADPRTDIFALGVLLYEMATGKRAFEGKSRASLIASIMSAEPQPMSVTVPMTPPALDRVVRACLEKDADERWQSAHDVARELRWLSSEERAATTARAPRRAFAPLLLALIGVLAAVLGFAAARATAPKPKPDVIRFAIQPPEGHGIRSTVLSPDGRAIAYMLVQLDTRRSSLWVRSFSEQEPRRLMDVDRLSTLFWSPDSRRVAFFTLGKLQAVHVGTGAVQTISDVVVTGTQAPHGRWGSKGTILFESGGSIFRVSARGGQPVLAAKPGPGETEYRFPTFLPDGDRFLFFVRSGEERDREGVYLASLQEPTRRKRLLETDSTFASVAEYAEPGYLIETRAEKVLAWSFDLERGEVHGDPVVLVDGADPQTARNPTSVSEFGSLAYRTVPLPSADQVVVVDRTGKEKGNVGPAGAIWHLALSPDERFLALEMLDPKVATTDLWLVDLETQAPARITFEPSFEWQAVWSPDGRLLYFASNRADQSDVYAMPPAGGAEARLVYRDRDMQAPMDVSADGKFLLIADRSSHQSFDITAVPLAGGKPIPVARSSFDERCGRFSPDGKWVTYDSTDSGERQVFLQSFPDPTRKSQISTGGGMNAVWRRDGRELYYLSPAGELMSVSLHPEGDDLRASRPSMLFRFDRSVSAASLSRYLYAPTRSGTEFFMRKQVSAPVETPVHVILNATSLLE